MIFSGGGCHIKWLRPRLTDKDEANGNEANAAGFGWSGEECDG